MKRSVALSAALALAGCGTAATPPSLAPRPIETRGDATDAARPVPAPRPLDAALAARIASILADATKGDAAFTKADTAGSAANSGAKNSLPGSELWVSREQARSALEAARQQTVTSLSEIDALVIAQAEATANDPSKGGLAELQAAQAVIEAMVNRQNARIEALAAH